MTIGDRFRLLRGNRSQPEFAALIGSTKQNISKYEMNSMMPGGDVLLRMAQTLNVNINWLLTGDGSQFTNDISVPSKRRKGVTC